MTISTTTSSVTYQGNGSTTAFTFPFVGVASGDLTVSLTDSNSVVTLLNPSQYSVSLNAVAPGGLWGVGGTVTYPLAGSPLSAGNKLTITRALPYTQDVSISNQGAFYPQAVEQAMDKLELQIQQIETSEALAIHFPISGGLLPNDLPGAAQRANNVIGFDSNGQIEMVPNENVTITVNNVTQVKDSFSQPVLGYTNSPPGSPVNSDRYLIGNTPTGTWTGKAGLIAEYDSSLGAWTFSPTPKQGQTIYNSDILNSKLNPMWWIYRNTWWNKVLSEVPGAMYQDFGDVPDGTSTSAMILASGHNISPTGPGQTGAVVTGGKIVAGSGGNTYNVVNYPYKNVRFGMKYAFQAGHTGSSYEATLAAGTYQAGQIITKMVHTEYLYENYGDMSIWGGPRRTIVGGSPLPYLAWQDVQYHYRSADDNYVTTAAPGIVYAEMYINGNNVISHNDYGKFTDSYTDAMVSGSLGNDNSGNLGYLYFQQGTATDAFVPYIYMIFAEPVAATEDMPNPQFLPNTSGVPTTITKNLTWNGGVQSMCSFNMGDYAFYTIEVRANVAAIGTTPGYAQSSREYLVSFGIFGGVTNSSSQALCAELVSTENAAVINPSIGFNYSISGSTVTLTANPLQTGTDATSTNQTTYIITNIVGGSTFS